MRSSLAIDELSAHFAQSTIPAAWLDLAYGRMSANDAAAAMAEVEPPELVERSKALFVPPSTEAEERRLEALLSAHFPVPARRRVPRWLQSSVVALAAASLVLVIVQQIGRPRPFDGGYELRMSSGYLEEREGPAPASQVTSEVERYRMGQRIELVVRPRETVTGVSAVAFVVTGGTRSPLRTEPTINEDGVVSFAGTPEALGLPLGRSLIVVVIGPREHLPARDSDEGVQENAEAPYDVVEHAVEIVAAPDLAAP